MKIVILTEALYQPPFIGKMLMAVAEIPGVYISVCILHLIPSPSPSHKLLQHWKKGRRGYLLILILQTLSRKISQKFKPGRNALFNLQTWLQQHNITLVKTSELYSETMLKTISNTGADAAILAGYHHIVKSAFIGLFPKGVLSYHYGDLRKYRGQPAGFWELYYGEREFKVTVQKISEATDKGIPVAEQRFEIGPYTTLRDLDKLVEHSSHTLMSTALQRLMSPAYSDEIPEQYGKLYTLPRLRQWIWFQLKMASRVLRRQLTRVKGL